MAALLQPLPYRIDLQLQAVGQRRLALAPEQHILAGLPAAVRIDVVRLPEKLEIRPQQLPELCFGPDVKGTFFQLAIRQAVCVEGGVKTASFGREPGLHEPEASFHGLPVQRVAVTGIAPGVKAHQLCIVVEHFFKMGHMPAGVYRIPGKTPAQRVVQPAVRHRPEAQAHVLAHRFVPARLAPVHEQLQGHGHHEFGGTPHAPVFGVETRFPGIDPAADLLCGNGRSPRVGGVDPAQGSSQV